MTDQLILVLDSLFDDVDVEQEAARSLGWRLERWEGSDALLDEAVVAVHVRTQVDEGLLQRMPACRVVGRFGTGLDSVDLQAARRRDIAVVGVRDYCTPELTAHTLGLAFMLERRLAAASTTVVPASASWDEIVGAFRVTGRQVVAVIGFGVIGRAVSHALLACGFSVLVVTAHGASEARSLGAEPVELGSALARAEMVFLHAALTRDTVRLMDAKRLAQMRPDALLIDTARLGLIDETAVMEALVTERLGGLALDARLGPDSPLHQLMGDPRVVVTPHVGWYSRRSSRILRQRTIVDSIKAVAAEGGGS